MRMIGIMFQEFIIQRIFLVEVGTIIRTKQFSSKHISSKQLLESKWWEGPAWLKLSSDNWTVSEIKVNDAKVYSVRKKSVAAVGVMVSNSSLRES